MSNSYRVSSGPYGYPNYAYNGHEMTEYNSRGGASSSSMQGGTYKNGSGTGNKIHSRQNSAGQQG